MAPVRSKVGVLELPLGLAGRAWQEALRVGWELAGATTECVPPSCMRPCAR